MGETAVLPPRQTFGSRPSRALARIVRRGLTWGCVVLIALAAFFAAWWAYQDRPLRQMRAAVRDGKWLDGLRRALDYLAKHPQDAEAWKLAARCYGAMGQFGAVEECLAKAGDLDTADLRLRADALIHLERNTQAVEVLRELLAKGGKDPAVLRGLAILEFRRGFHEEAFGLARQLAEFPEHEPTAWYLQATLHNMTRHHQDAVSCLKKALELNPEADRCGVPPDSVLWYLGATLLDTGKSDEAREYFRRALQHAESADSYFSLGEAEEGSGNLAAAEQAWRRALQIDPKFAESMFALAKLALKQNRPEEAIDWLQLAERAGKQGVAIENALSRAYARLDRPDLAQEHARRAEALMAEADAKHEEDSLLTNYPRNIHARMLMTRRAIDSGNIAEAAALVEESLREHPDNPQLLRLRQILSETK